MSDKQKITINAPVGYEFVRQLKASETSDLTMLVAFEIKPTEPKPHAALIAQCEQDKIDYPDFWWELWQRKDSEKKWHFIHKESPFFEKDCYRPHPHRASIIEFHACSDADKLRWQTTWGGKVQWVDIDKALHEVGDIPNWRTVDDTEYRLRPKICQVTINGKVLEYPEPVREPLGIGQEYWAIMVACGDIDLSQWDNCNLDINRLKNNVIHLTEQAAQTHMAVLQAVNAQVAI